MKLDASVIATLDELPPGKSDAIYFDDAITGFGYRLRRRHDHRLARTRVAQYRATGAPWARDAWFF